MIKRLLSILFILLFSQGIMAQTAEFETASEAVKNMKIGWNLWNTLDAYAEPGDWFKPEGWWSWETVWGNPVTKPELMKMIRKSGFKALRLPVTWFPHTDKDGNIDPAWMARVHEVVDYVIDQGMYCLLNTHHETAFAWDEATNTITQQQFLMAEVDNYRDKKAWFENLWRQIAEEFRDYDQHLLFEAYNEMTDKYGQWGCPAWEGEEHVKQAYKAINDYAQSFVNAVRSTGGKNRERNLVVNTYSACTGPGDEESLRQMDIPKDVTDNHIIFGIHYYGDMDEGSVGSVISFVLKHIASRGVPTIISEWGGYFENDNDYNDSHGSFVQKARDNNIATFLWGGISSESNRSLPVFDGKKNATNLLKAYYGDWYEPQLLTVDDYDYSACKLTFTNLWAQFRLCSKELSLNDYKGIRLVMENPNDIHLLINGDNDGKQQREVISSSSISFDFDKSILGSIVSNIELQNVKEGKNETIIYHVYLIKNDGTEEEVDQKDFVEIWGCEYEKTFKRKQFVHTVAYDERWSELNIFYDDVPLKLKNYKGIKLELAEQSENCQIKIYGDGEQKEDYLPLTGTSTTIMFNTGIFSSEINRVTLQYTNETKGEAKVISAWLIRQDGTEEYSDLSPFHGCKITDITKYEGNSDAKDQYLVNPSFDYDLSGWTNTNGTARWKENTWEVLSNYCEFEWTGGPIVNQEVVQFPTLPAGNYRLSFDCASDTNSKGLYLVAGSNTKELPETDGINSFSLDFSVAEESPIKIGFKVENTTATWVNFDNFKLEKISSTAINSIKSDESHHAVIYNLSGQRLSRPQKGINIIDGKKVVVK